MKSGAHTLRRLYRNLANVRAAQQVLLSCWGFDHFSSYISLFIERKKAPLDIKGFKESVFSHIEFILFFIYIHTHMYIYLYTYLSMYLSISLYIYIRSVDVQLAGT